MSTANAATGCQGCGENVPTSKYTVTYHEHLVRPGQPLTENVNYCDDCAELASADWNGNTESITPLTETPGPVAA